MAALAFGLLGLACGAVAQSNINLNDYTLNFVDAAEADAPGNNLGLSNPTSVDEWRITIHSVVVVDDPGPNIAAGQRFHDYFMVSVDRFVDKDAAPVVTPNYGNTAYGAGLTVTHEMTVMGVVSGTVNSFNPATGLGVAGLDLLPELSQFDIIFDAATDGSSQAAADADFSLSTPTDWATFSDGTTVEQINGLTFGQIVLTNVTVPTIVDGAIDIKGPLTDVLATLGNFDKFELDYVDENGDLIDVDEMRLQGIADANFTLDENLFGSGGADLGLINDFLAEFGTSVGADQFALGFRSDASFNKAAVIIPEPLSAGLGAVALGSLAGYLGGRRRRA
ncbi:MAG: hypothetical protein CMJ18_05065 [Phycisphaeraceae bacterium]|nr:hypothetical protein [Phycisphaeraceae bacterium]